MQRSRDVPTPSFAQKSTDARAATLLLEREKIMTSGARLRSAVAPPPPRGHGGARVLVALVAVAAAGALASMWTEMKAFSIPKVRSPINDGGEHVERVAAASDPGDGGGWRQDGADTAGSDRADVAVPKHVPAARVAAEPVPRQRNATTATVVSPVEAAPQTARPTARAAATDENISESGGKVGELVGDALARAIDAVRNRTARSPGFGHPCADAFMPRLAPMAALIELWHGGDRSGDGGGGLRRAASARLLDAGAHRAARAQRHLFALQMCRHGHTARSIPDGSPPLAREGSSSSKGGGGGDGGDGTGGWCGAGVDGALVYVPGRGIFDAANTGMGATMGEEVEVFVRAVFSGKTGLHPSSVADGTEMGSPLPTGNPEWWASETGAPRLMLPMDRRHGSVFGWAYADKRACRHLGLSCYFQPVAPCAAPRDVVRKLRKGRRGAAFLMTAQIIKQRNLFVASRVSVTNNGFYKRFCGNGGGRRKRAVRKRRAAGHAAIRDAVAAARAAGGGPAERAAEILQPSHGDFWPVEITLFQIERTVLHGYGPDPHSC